MKASSTTETTKEDSTEKVEESVDEAEQAREEFSCPICDFVSNWENGLGIHMTKKHANLEQLDGGSSISEDAEESDKKYSETIRYWKEGKLGTVFQSYLDAITCIEESDFSEDVKTIEKAKVLEARKLAFGSEFK